MYHTSFCTLSVKLKVLACTPSVHLGCKYCLYESISALRVSRDFWIMRLWRTSCEKPFHVSIFGCYLHFETSPHLLQLLKRWLQHFFELWSSRNDLWTTKLPLTCRSAGGRVDNDCILYLWVNFSFKRQLCWGMLLFCLGYKKDK